MSDSHTNFNAGSFTAGALSGSLAIAGAVVASLQQARANNWHRWDRQALIAGIELSELRRVQLYKGLQVANRRVSDLQTEIIGLRAELQAERARMILMARK